MSKETNPKYWTLQRVITSLTTCYNVILLISLVCSQGYQGGTHLNCWCSLELLIFEENLSASLSKLREYSSSISALRRKNSCRSCSSWMRDSDCCSKHLNCSTSWLRISEHQKNETEISKLFILPSPLCTTCPDHKNVLKSSSIAIS